MKKVINITVGGMVFLIEEAAYDRLNDYLNALRRHFAKDKAGEEILEDIECSVADKFSKRKVGAISEADVELLISQMGSLKDFKGLEGEDEEADQDENEEIPYRKRLYRDTEDEVIAGVAAGMAAYFGIDTAIMRLIFFVSLFFGGLGFFIYVVLWIVMPEAKTRTQRLEMRGERITLKEIERSVKAEVGKLKKKDWDATKKSLTDKFDGFFDVLGRIFWTVVGVLRSVIGVALVIGAVAGILASSLVFSWQISGAQLPYTDLNFSEFLGFEGGTYIFLVLALYMVVLVPLTMLLIGGLSLLKKRLVGGAVLFGVLLLLWVIALGFAAPLILENSAHIEGMIRYLDHHGYR